MKLAKQSGGNWQYALYPSEFELLCQLLYKFPYTKSAPAKISKTDKGPKSVEREELLNESLFDHRKELKRQAANLLAGAKVKKNKKHYLLTLTVENREFMLQILNDIRVGCWRAQGEPASLALRKPDGSAQELKYHNLMSLAGYFEQHLIGPK